MTPNPALSELLLHTARQAAGAQQYPPRALYVVATPIGNLADLTLRAIHVLALVDAVACEDTRVTATLLRHLGLSKPLLAVHEHNEREASAEVAERLARDERVAFVSDAGTPAVSDPGARLVASLRDRGYRCIPIAGASAVSAALSVAGDDRGEGGFRFVGFLAAKPTARREALTQLAREASTLVLFESPHRIAALIGDLATTMPRRRITVARELTKQFESIVTLAGAALPSWFASNAQHARGEFVIVLHAMGADAPRGDLDHDRLLDALLAAMPLKQAVAVAAAATGAARNALYARALDRSRAAEPDDGGNTSSG